MYEDLIARMDAVALWKSDWDESKHPRADNGQFGSGSGGSSSGSSLVDIMKLAGIEAPLDEQYEYDITIPLPNPNRRYKVKLNIKNIKRGKPARPGQQYIDKNERHRPNAIKIDPTRHWWLDA